MDRHIARVLLSAWVLPEFRDALQHVIDLDEVTNLLTAFASGAPDDQTRERGLELARTAMQTPEVRNALVLLLAKEDFRTKLATLVQAATPDRPGWPPPSPRPWSTRQSPHKCKAVDSQIAGKRGRLVTAGLSLLAKKEVRGLLASLRHDGLVRGATR